MVNTESITTELDVVKKMAELMKDLDEDGKRRALWYLADLAGLSQRTTTANQPQANQMPVGQMRRGPISNPTELNMVMAQAAQRAKDQAAVREQGIVPNS